MDSLVASPLVVLPGGTVNLVVEAHDPDCAGSCTSGCGLYIRSDLTAWSATGGTFTSESNGTSSSPYSAAADWQAPATEGSYSLTVDLADSGTFLCGGRQTTSASVDILVSTSTNQPPAIDALIASPSSVLVDQPSALSCSATDPEGDPITYTWATDLGTVVPGNDGEAVLSSATPGIATVVCTATDSGGAPGSDFVLVSVHGALPEARLLGGLLAPQRVAVDSSGHLYVVDGGRGLTVVHLAEGELVYRLPLPGLAAVAVDWEDRLLVGGTFGLRTISRAGEPLQTLAPPSASLDVADVAVDPVDQLYAVLYRRSGTVRVFDAAGAPVLTFGSTGDGPEQFKSPQGLTAVAEGSLPSTGRWIVADTGHGALKVFDSAGSLVATMGGLGGGVGEFVQLDDVAVSQAGIVYATDSFQDWVQAFDPDGSPREVLGTYGDGVGEFQTAAGLTLAESFDRLVVASTNSSSLQSFTTVPDPTMPPPPPQGTVSPAAIDFGGQSVGTTSPWQNVVVTNQGGRALGILDIATTGHFAHQSDCPVFLDPGQSCTAQVTFAPLIPGKHNGALTVDVSWGDPLVVALDGRGFIPSSVILTPGSIFFPDQLVGTVSDDESVLVVNGGTAGLVISSIDVHGDFGYVSSCPGVVAGGESCEILVHFMPMTVGDEILGALSLVTNAAGSPHVLPLGGSSFGSDTLISVADLEVSESARGAIFPVQLSVPAEGPISVQYRTVADTAKGGEDFIDVTGTLIFPAGETLSDVWVPLLDDTVLEPSTERFWVELHDAIGGQIGESLGSATLVDDEVCPSPNLLINGGAEVGLGGNSIPGWQAPSPSMAWSISTGPPDPFEGEAFFYAGTAERVEIFQDVPLAAYADPIDAGEAWFAFEGWVRSASEPAPDTVRLILEYRDADNEKLLETFDSGWIASIDEWLRVGDRRQAPAGTRWLRTRLLGHRHSGLTTDAMVDALALHSERLPTISLSNAATLEEDTGSHALTFAAPMSCPYWREVELTVQTSDGTATAGEDYLALDGTLTIPAGEPTGSIDVEILGDTQPEPDETFLLHIDALPGELPVVLDPQADGTILDDDGPVHNASWWLRSPKLWPPRIRIADESWGHDAIRLALAAVDRDPVVRLVRELVAARLNLSANGPREVEPVAAQSDALLSRLSTEPESSALERRAAALADRLEAYNEGRGLAGGMP